ncbi:MAG: hypothetical protein WCS85_00455 [Candidatus Peribacteraceae bacterium]|jgi:hypothetical protein
MTFLMHFLSATFHTVSVQAAVAPWPLCPKGLPGCGKGTANMLGQAILPIANLILGIAAAASVIGIVYSGLQMLLSGGDEGKAMKGRDGIVYALGGLALAMSSQSLVSFVVTQNFGQSGGDVLFSGLFPGIVQMGVAVFNGLLVLVLVYAGVKMVMAQGKSDEYRKGMTIIKWAVIGAIVTNLGRSLVLAFLNLNISW